MASRRSSARTAFAAWCDQRGYVRVPSTLEKRIDDEDLSNELGVNYAHGRDGEDATEYRRGSHPVLLDRFVCSGKRDKPIERRGAPLSQESAALGAIKRRASSTKLAPPRG